MTGTAIIGDIGSGKTLLMTILATLSKREVYSNFKLLLPNQYKIDEIGLLDIKKDVDVFLDEFYLMADSRTATAVLNRFLTYSGMQQRKNIIDMYISAQYFRMIDVRFRDLSSYIIKCEYDEEEEVFYYETLNVSKGYVDDFHITLENAKPYFEIYDTYEIIDPARKLFYRLKLMKKYDSPKYMKECMRIALELLPIISDLTHPKLIVKLLERGYPEFIESEVYVYLREMIDESKIL